MNSWIDDYKDVMNCNWKEKYDKITSYGIDAMIAEAEQEYLNEDSRRDVKKEEVGKYEENKGALKAAKEKLERIKPNLEKVKNLIGTIEKLKGGVEEYDKAIDVHNKIINNERQIEENEERITEATKIVEKLSEQIKDSSLTEDERNEISRQITMAANEKTKAVNDLTKLRGEKDSLSKELEGCKYGNLDRETLKSRRNQANKAIKTCENAGENLMEGNGIEFKTEEIKPEPSEKETLIDKIGSFFNGKSDGVEPESREPGLESGKPESESRKKESLLGKVKKFFKNTGKNIGNFMKSIFNRAPMIEGASADKEESTEEKTETIRDRVKVNLEKEDHAKTIELDNDIIKMISGLVLDGKGGIDRLANNGADKTVEEIYKEAAEAEKKAKIIRMQKLKAELEAKRGSSTKTVMSEHGRTSLNDIDAKAKELKAQNEARLRNQEGSER